MDDALRKRIESIGESSILASFLQQFGEDRAQFVDFKYAKLPMDQASISVQDHGKGERRDSVTHPPCEIQCADIADQYGIVNV